jgi:hypothetical protein
LINFFWQQKISELVSIHLFTLTYQPESKIVEPGEKRQHVTPFQYVAPMYRWDMFVRLRKKTGSATLRCKSEFRSGQSRHRMRAGGSRRRRVQEKEGEEMQNT